MGKKIRLMLILSGFLIWSLAMGQNAGEKMFKQVCSTCHTIGQGRKVGPDLANVQNRRSEEWLINFVRSPRSVINSGDPVAQGLLKEFNGIVMPDNSYSPDQVRSILQYIAANSSGPQTSSRKSESEIQKSQNAVPPGDSRAGENLFWGKQRFSAGAATCGSCHNLYDRGVRAGGALGKDLTDAYTRLGESGIRAILSRPPFPVMARAFENRALTKAEVSNLTAYLNKVSEAGKPPQVVSIRMRMLIAGVTGAIILLFLLMIWWIRTKRDTVNAEIFSK